MFRIAVLVSARAGDPRRPAGGARAGRSGRRRMARGRRGPCRRRQNRHLPRTALAVAAQQHAGDPRRRAPDRRHDRIRRRADGSRRLRGDRLPAGVAAGMHENIYLRPRSSGEFMAVQYAPRMNGSSTWQLYPEFTAADRVAAQSVDARPHRGQRIAPGDLRRERNDAGRVGSSPAARVDGSGRRGVLGPGQRQAGRMGGGTLEHPDPACALARAADPCAGGAAEYVSRWEVAGPVERSSRRQRPALRTGLEASRRRRVGAGQPQRGLRRAAAAGPLHRVCADVHRRVLPRAGCSRASATATT